ncbi:MAG: hypothetical protein ACI88H_002449 [Cocleimonas sp.]|jgi:hypothetical protein
MEITNLDTLRQALANIRLESLTLPEEIETLFNKVLSDPDFSLDTEDIKKLMLDKYINKDN